MKQRGDRLEHYAIRAIDIVCAILNSNLVFVLSSNRFRIDSFCSPHLCIVKRCPSPIVTYNHKHNTIWDIGDSAHSCRGKEKNNIRILTRAKLWKLQAKTSTSTKDRSYVQRICIHWICYGAFLSFILMCLLI